MAETEVTIGYNSTYEISTNGGSTWVEVDEITNISPPAFSTDTPDATHMKSPNRTREFISGLIDAGEASMTINYIPGSDSDVLLKGLQVAGTRFSARETYPNGVTSTYTGIVSGLTAAVPLDDKMSMDVTIKVASAVTAGSTSAPANTVLPSIVGASVQVDVTLTAIEGKFSGAPTSYAYQWQHDASGNGTFTNVSVGGTSKTYVPVVGDIADFLRVGITPTNGAGAGTVVYSLPVGPIIAA